MTAPEPVGPTDGEREALAEVIAGIDGGRLADASARAYDACLRAADAVLTSEWLADRLAAERAAHDPRPWRDCTGAGDCPGPWHIHGCFADDGQCDDPQDHADAAREAQVLAGDRLRAAVEALREASEDPNATPGEWEVWPNLHRDPYIVEKGTGPITGGIALANRTNDYGRANALLIVAAVNHLRAALAAAAPTPPQDAATEGGR